MKKFVVLLTLVGALPVLGEGMWMPQQIPQLAGELRKMGIKIDPNRLSDLTGDPLGAIVQLPGCTASFVSAEGLIATNHHCAFGSVQHNSTPERNLMANGFLAKSRDQELPAAPGTKVWVTTKIEDVTSRVTGSFPAKITDADRARTIDRREKELVSECEKAGGVRCRVGSFFEGAQYLRLTQAEISDVRLVYAPAQSIGEFGGDIDNFEWPRHTGDFSFYRAYVDGKPYRPKHWLKVSTEGINEGDLVMVAGYPGRTFRYKTADEVRSQKEFFYPTSARYYTEVIRLLEEAGKNDKAVAIRNASRIKSFNNSLKNYTAVSEGFSKDRIVEAREQREAEMRRAIAADPSLAKHAQALDEIARLNAEHLRTRERDLILTWLARSQAYSQALTINRVALERAKKNDIDRLAGYQERDWSKFVPASDRVQRTLDLASDRAILRYFLIEAGKLPADQRIKPIDDAVAAAGSVDALVEKLYASSQVTSQDARKAMLGETAAQLKARNDAMLNFTASLLPLVEANEERDRAYSGAMARLRPGYFETLRKVSGGTLYPDANSTLRVTFGKVTGYRPKDAIWYTPQTTLTGLVAKEKGAEPFANPPALLAVAKDVAKTRPYVDRELGDVPVNFLSTCDTTGGNSGSPTLNAKGELAGLLFDGNYESIDADFLFNEADTRSIHVDTMYMLWVMDAVDGAHDLMRELGVEPKFAK